MTNEEEKAIKERKKDSANISKITDYNIRSQYHFKRHQSHKSHHSLKHQNQNQNRHNHQHHKQITHHKSSKSHTHHKSHIVHTHHNHKKRFSQYSNQLIQQAPQRKRQSELSHINMPPNEIMSPNQSPTNQNQTYHQQQQLHQQQIQRTGGLQRLTADLAGLQFNDAEALYKSAPKAVPKTQPKLVQQKIPIKAVVVNKSIKTLKFVNTRVVEVNVNQEVLNNDSMRANEGQTTSPGAAYEEQMVAHSSGSQGSELDTNKDAQETSEDATILKRFKIIQLVGIGNYARVYKAISSNGRELAIKSINLSKTSENYRQKFLPRELAILKKVSHVNICKIHEILQVSDRVFIIMQFCSRGTIADLLHKAGPLSEPITRNLISQTLDAVNYMHSIDLAHRDLKVENILLDSEYTPKLTDFSYSNFIVEKAGAKSVQPQQQRNLKTQNSKSMSTRSIKLNETFCGTLPYLSPEMIRQYPYDPRKTDVWSLGVCLYVMLNDRLPFPFNDIKSMVKKQLSKDFKFRAHVEFSDQVKDLVSLMLEPDHTKRPFCYELLKHFWFSGARERPYST